jgi:hypothetical protein
MTLAREYASQEALTSRPIGVTRVHRSSEYCTLIPSLLGE